MSAGRLAEQAAWPLRHQLSGVPGRVGQGSASVRSLCKSFKWRTTQQALIFKGFYRANVMHEMEGRMAIVGYARVSTDGQTFDAQHAVLKAAGAEKVFTEKVSGAKTDRRQTAARH
jgi:hypothetical protein